MRSVTGICHLSAGITYFLIALQISTWLDSDGPPWGSMRLVLSGRSESPAEEINIQQHIIPAISTRHIFKVGEETSSQ